MIDETSFEETLPHRSSLMTSFAFILGVAPLAMATRAGSEMRQSIGTAVLFGMLGMTVFGLLFTPAFYTIVRKFRKASFRSTNITLPKTLKPAALPTKP